MEYLKPHQQRVVAEKLELEEKIGKLLLFIDRDDYETLADEPEQERLEAQLTAMTKYAELLGERIAAFK